eukprot:CAMPEP_0184858086 /NCGR_PEP_ID=MMETSP0580-20130426/3188_1 /TAXON_ID=1118495 /ORGANISM="Dactyliosolen fragilissimus" /LENGTH=683 /DNA_ID=CAMNT_0027354013 /DNA_START=661 /DNA_END=2709 /DNA_ORIENTATION=+
MESSKLSKLDMREAKCASSILWPAILENSEVYKTLTPRIRFLCGALHAETLARVGKDEEAVRAVSKALSNVVVPKKAHEAQVRCDTVINGLEDALGDAYLCRGRALQRLMRYSEARDSYVLSCESILHGLYTISAKSKTKRLNASFLQQEEKALNAICAAALCEMRLGRLKGAREIIEHFIRVKGRPHSNRKDHNDLGFLNNPNLAGLYGTLMLMMGERGDTIHMEFKISPLDLLKFASTSELGDGNCDSNTNRKTNIKNNFKDNSKYDDSIINIASPLYQWIYAVMMNNGNIFSNRKNIENLNNEGIPFLFPNSGDVNREIEHWFLKLITINHSAFDDANLILLDNKVLLHNLLSSNEHSSKTRWPLSFVIPRDVDKFLSQHQKNSSAQQLWMLKKPSSYGSHGNHIVTYAYMKESYKLTPKVNEIDHTYEQDTGEFHSNKIMNAYDPRQVLCQSFIDPPCLLDERKFSLRIYVLYFASPKSDALKQSSLQNSSNPVSFDAFLSNIGLVKLASRKYTERLHHKLHDIGLYEEKSNIHYSSQSEDRNDMHMTNSGRIQPYDEGNIQYDLTYLQTNFGKERYNTLWEIIRQSVIETMLLYTQSIAEDFQSCPVNVNSKNNSKTILKEKERVMTAINGIPKIMGFDYMLDAFDRPWLMEVNRFPGLEPRDACDTPVKTTVVMDAW